MHEQACTLQWQQCKLMFSAILFAKCINCSKLTAAWTKMKLFTNHSHIITCTLTHTHTLLKSACTESLGAVALNVFNLDRYDGGSLINWFHLFSWFNDTPCPFFRCILPLLLSFVNLSYKTINPAINNFIWPKSVWFYAASFCNVTYCLTTS